MAATREDADKAFGNFLEKYQAKYPAACECLAKDRDVLLTFYDFPAENWRHLRTTNPIESTFATIRLRHRRTKGSGSLKTSLTMMFKLAHTAQKGWRKLNGHEKFFPLFQGKKSSTEKCNRRLTLLRTQLLTVSPSVTAKAIALSRRKA